MNKYIKKQLISRDKKLYYDFMPEMAELTERPTNPVTTVILYLCLALIVITVCWACLMKLDVVVTATGYMDMEDPIETVRFVSGGKITEVYARDGMTVGAGEVICRLDSEIESGEVEKCDHDLEVLRIQLDLYKKLYDKYKSDDYTSLDDDPDTYGDNSTVAEAVILENDIFIDSLRDLDTDEKETLKKNRLYLVTNNINRLNREIEEQEVKADSLKRELNSRVVTAETSGIVSLSDALYPGKIVASGENVCVISKEQNKYIFKAYVADEDIVDIGVGDTVRLRLPGYDDTKYEYLDGTITEIGSLPVKAEGLGTVYPVDISVNGIPDDMKQGMEGKMDIIIGTRTVMDYFLEPFRKGLDNSMKEK